MIKRIKKNQYLTSGFKIKPLPSELENIILNKIKKVKNKKVLDLFSCTARLSIKLNKKGASFINVVEKNKNYIKKIEEKKIKNLKTSNEDVFKFLKINKKIKYDIIIIDPPYEIKLFKKLFVKITKIIKKKGLIIYRRKKNINNKKLYFKGFIIKKKIKKKNEIIFIKKQTEFKKC